MSEESSFEELEQPRRIGAPVRIATAVVVLAAVAFGIARVADSPPAAAPAAERSMDRVPPPLPLRLPLPLVRSSAAIPPGPAGFQLYLPPRRCPPAGDGQNACSTYHQVSAQFLAAVRARYPRLATRFAVTQLLRASGPDVRPGLWSVQYTGVSGSLRLRIVVDRAEPGDRGRVGSATSTGRRFEFLRLVHGRYTVQLEAHGEHGLMPEPFKLASLANDPGLLRSPAATMDP